MSLLVTGANGFLGSAIVKLAVELGMRVRGTDRAASAVLPSSEYFQADILDPSCFRQILPGINTVIHAAGLAHIFGKSKAVHAPFTAINEVGTANVARSASQFGVKHFILISSVSVYGGSRGDGGEQTGCFPDSPYAESKYQAELRAIDIAKTSGMALTILRLATLYGEGDPGNVARLMRAIDRGRFIWIGDGSNRKSLLYRDDAARACLVVAQHPASSVNVYNVSAPPRTMRQIVQESAAALGRSVPTWHLPASLILAVSDLVSGMACGKGRLGSLRTMLRKWLADDVYNADKFEQVFDFRTHVSLETGLRREAAYYRGGSIGSGVKSLK